MLVKKCGSTR